MYLQTNGKQSRKKSGHIFLALMISIMMVWGCSQHQVRLDPMPTIEGESRYSSERPDTAPKDVTLSFKPAVSWWHEFDDSALNTMVTQSLSNNQNVVQALERVRQANLIIPQTRSNRLPQINLEGDLGYTIEGPNRNRSDGQIGAALQWEIDAFNRIGAAVNSDRFEAMARSEDVQALQLRISADVATAYFGAVAAHHTLNLLDQQVRIDKALLDLLELRFKNGVGTQVEVMQQQSRVADSESLIPRAQADLRIFENRLDVLLGQMPDGQNRVSRKSGLDIATTLPPIGVPANLLMNRPDLRAAKASLIASDFDIEAAIADRLPRLTLDGTAAYADSAGNTGILSFIMGTFIQPLLDWGRRKAVVEQQQARYQERLAAFTQAYLVAVEDVENTLYRENRQREFIVRLEKRVSILKATLDETEARYSQGVDDYLPVLNALQELRELERDLIIQRLTLVEFRITLHRATGGVIDNVKTGTDS